MAKHFLVLDFGGSAVKCAVMTQAAKIKEQFSISSQAGSYSEWIETFTPHFQRLNPQYELQGIAVSTCGAVDVDTGIIHGSSALPYIHDFDVRALYELAFGLPTELENDACCAALAESWLGEGKCSKHFCLLVIGSGIGGAIVTDGQVQKGNQLHGGEFGYSIVDYHESRPVTFGNVASMRALVESATDSLGLNSSELDGIEVFEMYDAGHSGIRDIVHHWARYLATGLYNIQYHVDPEYIVLGGAVSKRADLVRLIDTYLDHIHQQLPISRVRAVPRISQFGNDANLIGALRHFLNRQGY
ncbi:ROK family protein [Vibrio sp. 10N.286.52.B1]|uniref:ROK family protein n=1 Tax=Vibrio sp. 10N.286.52.B1 TaxID=3229712 RepID=UPI00354FF4CF